MLAMADRGGVSSGALVRPRVLVGNAEAGDRGDAALELLILAPVMLALIGLVIAAGRTSVAEGAVEAAARDAARQASISLTPAAARQAALASAYAALRGDGLACKPTVTLDVAQGFATPLGQPAEVSASVSCTVRLSDLLVPGLPGSRTLTARFTSPLDPYRSRAVGFETQSQRRHIPPTTIRDRLRR
jgi:Flp pilus assembly protein TadG